MRPSPIALVGLQPSLGTPGIDHMRALFDPVAKGLAGVLIDLGLDAVEPKSIVGGATDRSHGDIAIPFHKFAGVLRLSLIHI